MKPIWVCIVSLCVVVAAAAAFGAGKSAAPDVIQAQRFELVDADGEVRARLSVAPTIGPSLFLYDDRGEVRVRLRLTPDGCPSLELWDEEGRGGAAVFVGTEDSPTMVLRRRDGVAHAELSAKKLALYDEAAKEVWSAP
jgi:hypothetical protein